MTFDNIVAEIAGRLNYTSTDATTRLGKSVNRAYRRVTTAIGMVVSRRTTITQARTVGSALVTFTGIEKIERVFIDTSGSVVMLDEVPYDELRNETPASSDDARRYAIKSHTDGAVTILLDALAATTANIKADGHAVLADINGSTEPAFPESFHDILIEMVMAEELRKQEKPALAKIAKDESERILSDLKFFVAKSGYLQNRQGGRDYSRRDWRLGLN